LIRQQRQALFGRVDLAPGQAPEAIHLRLKIREALLEVGDASTHARTVGADDTTR
jgi:hypothetical protein